MGLPRYFPGSTECQIIVFGGNAHIKGDSGARDNIADLHVLHFGRCMYMHSTLYTECLKRERKMHRSDYHRLTNE